jgi:hypothetical protein
VHGDQRGSLARRSSAVRHPGSLHLHGLRQKRQLPFWAVALPTGIPPCRPASCSSAARNGQLPFAPGWRDDRACPPSPAAPMAMALRPLSRQQAGRMHKRYSRRLRSGPRRLRDRVAVPRQAAFFVARLPNIYVGRDLGPNMLPRVR